tara:strand:- start:48 stop:551 length:504 start_codon:yes stop_codon:yes gene_type:complete
MTSYAQKLTQAHYTDWIHDQFNKAVRRAEANWMVDAWTDTAVNARGEVDDCLTFKVDHHIAFEYDILNGLYIIPPDERSARVKQRIEDDRLAFKSDSCIEFEFAIMFRDFEREYCPRGIIRIDSPDDTTLLDKALCSCVSLEKSCVSLEKAKRFISHFGSYGVFYKH